MRNRWLWPLESLRLVHHLLRSFKEPGTGLTVEVFGRFSEKEFLGRTRIPADYSWRIWCFWFFWGYIFLSVFLKRDWGDHDLFDRPAVLLDPDGPGL